MEIFLGLISSLAFGILDILIAITSRSVGVVQSLFFAQAISACILLFYLFNVFVSGMSIQAFVSFLLVGVVLGSLNTLANISLYQGLKCGPITIVSSISATYGLITTILALFFLHERISLFQIIGVGLTLTGIVLMAVENSGIATMKIRVPLIKQKKISFATIAKKISNSPASYLGLLFGLGSMVGFGLEFFGMSVATTYLGPIQPILWSRLCSVVMLSGIRGRSYSWRGIQLKQFGVLILIGVLDTIGMLWYNLGTNLGATSIIAALSSTYILLPMLMGTLIYHERLSWLQWFGICLLIGGVITLSLY